MAKLAALLELAGGGIILVGLWYIWPPVAVVVGGAGLLLVAQVLDKPKIGGPT